MSPMPPPPPTSPARPARAALRRAHARLASRRRGGERGFALLLVLLMTTIAIIVVAELAYQAGLEILAANNVSDQGLIEYAIDGQFEIALANLKLDKKSSDKDLDAETETWNNKDIRQRTDGDVALTMRIFDEAGKFNLVRLVTGNEAQQLRAKEVFIRILDLFRDGIAEDKSKGGDLNQGEAEEVADRIIKYLKREGATGQVPKPKTLPASVPLLLDEIQFVDTKDNHMMDVLMVDLKVKDQVAPGLHRFVTVYGAQRINVNSAPLVVLKALFSQSGDQSYAQAIIDRRRGQADTSSSSSVPAMSSSSGSSSGTTDAGAGNPFETVQGLVDGSVNGLTDDVLRKNGIDAAVELDVKSDVFGIRIQGATKRTQRDELYVVERAKAADGTVGFRFLLHQERTDPLLTTEEDTSAESTP